MRHYPQGWINAYRQYVYKQESPDIFHFWVSATVISGVLQRNVWIDRGAYCVFPNLYTILSTASAMCRKSVAMDIGMELLRHVDGPHIIYERASLEGLMDAMERVEPRPDGRIVPNGSIFIMADELSDLFGKSSYLTDLMSFLTAAYTAKSTLQFSTRNKGVCTVRNPCPCILCGTTPEMFGEVFPSSVTTSGFLGRVVVASGKRAKREPKSELKTDMKDKLIDDLKDMATIFGEAVVTKECEARFTDWYMNMPEYSHGVLQAFWERRHDHIWKLAMLLSLSESNDLVIHTRHFDAALKAIEQIEGLSSDSTRFIGATPESVNADIVVNMITKHYQTTGKPLGHSYIMQVHFKRFRNGAEFNAMMDMLVDSGRIKVFTAGTGGIGYIA